MMATLEHAFKLRLVTSPMKSPFTSGTFCHRLQRVIIFGYYCDIIANSRVLSVINEGHLAFELPLRGLLIRF